MSSIELIVDRSGSMESLLRATTSGITEFVQLQKKLDGAEKATISLTTFDDKVEQPVKDVPLLDYTFDPVHIQPRGMTALYDALGKRFENIPFKSKRTVVIITDGDDNSSHTFTASSISSQITERRKFGWTFIFLAANQDAIAAGRNLSIPEETSCTFDAEEEGATMCAIRAASNVISRAHAGGPVGFTQMERAQSSGSAKVPNIEDEEEEGATKCASHVSGENYEHISMPQTIRATQKPMRGQTGF